MGIFGLTFSPISDKIVGYNSEIDSVHFLKEG